MIPHHPRPAKRLFCFGLGYTALTLARLLRAKGWEVAGTCQSEERRAQLQAEGIDQVHLFDRARPLPEAARLLAAFPYLLSSVPPDAAGDPVVGTHGPELARLNGFSWVGYLSTTGVYGDRGGGWVDEESPLRPVNERGRRRVLAETAWRDLPLPLHIFRLPGIYGPGRSALDAVRNGTARRIDRPGQVFCRIHVADLARALEASMAAPRAGSVYNICDDEPAPPAEIVAFACGLLGVPPPPLIPLAEAGLSAMARSFWDESKRVTNARMKRELNFRLEFPDYRAGLRDIMARPPDIAS